jgi:hypothetical protein
MLNVAMLIVILLSVAMPNVIMLSVAMLIVIILSVAMLTVVAPFKDCSPAGSLHSFVIADRLKH